MNAKKPLALIIEDDFSVANLCAIALQDAEFNTEIIHEGDAALIRLTEIKPSLILLDIGLPHISGHIILPQIWANTDLADTKIILTTGDAYAGQSFREQVDEVLIKPIRFTQLRDLAKDWYAAIQAS